VRVPELQVTGPQSMDRSRSAEVRPFKPLINPDTIREISSSSVISRACTSGVSNCLRIAMSRRGTHSCTLPRAIAKKFRRSGAVNRPFPSARFVAIESAARFS
jgi:hypothetical protein